MRTLYVSDQGAQIRRSGRLLRIELADQCIGRIPAQGLDHVFVFGEVSLTPAALHMLMHAGVPVALLSRGGKFIGRITPAAKGWVSRRRAQYAVADDPAYAVEFARAVIHAKLISCRALLRRHARNHPDADVAQGVAGLRRALRRAEAAGNLQQLRGAEGSGAAAYFGCFRALLRRELVFAGRTRRPPRDPVNALLSLGYSLLRAEVEAQLEALGLDPRVGFLHAERPGRPALALDIMEEFRAPVVDRLVLRSVNLGIVGPEDFEAAEDGGFRLAPPALKSYLRQYDRRLSAVFRDLEGKRTSYRRVLHRQARGAAEAFAERRPYRAFTARL